MKNSADYLSPRRSAVDMLLRLNAQDSYSNIVLEDTLGRLPLEAEDRAFVARLVYGVTERRLTLDYLLNHLASVPVKKMDASIREILRVALYQMIYLDKTPDFAAIHAAVDLTRSCGKEHFSGFVNAVLRAAQRDYLAMLAALPKTDKGLEIRYSCPREWIRAWRTAYGEEVLQGILDSLNDVPPTYVRMNTLHTDKERFTGALEALGVSYRPVEALPGAYEIQSAARLRDSTLLSERDYHFQDIASQWCCRALDARPGERIADVCAAPGGKSITVSQYMNGKGVIEAGELHSQRCDAMRQRLVRSGIECVRVGQRDASLAPPDDWIGAFDRVLCDVPCSGLGVIRRRPEIRYKKAEELANLPGLQLQILTQAARMVRPGGVLQYSTCTLRPEENEQVAEAFLAANPMFVPRMLPIEDCFARAALPISYSITLFPHIHGSDGFFIAGFCRNTEE